MPKLVGDLTHEILVEIVNEPVKRRGPVDPDPVVIRSVVIGAVSLHEQRCEARSIEMTQTRHELDHAVVFLERLVGKAVDEVPNHAHAIFTRPLEQPDVVQRADALIHQLENRRAEALDAGLDDHDAGVEEQLDVLFFEVRLRLVEEEEVASARAGVAQNGEQRLEIAQVQDIVDGLELRTMMLSAELVNFRGDAICGFAAERHR